MRNGGWAGVVLLLAAMGAPGAGVGWGQSGKIGVRTGGGSSLPLAAGASPATVEDALLQMAGRAAVMFVGHVEAVTRRDAAGYVDVQFRIDSAIRGCGGATVYVLREWAGLWTSGSAGGGQRYRVGDRRLMLLAARGPGGMSAPVGGLDGAIPLVATGVQPIANAAGEAPADGGGVDAGATVGVDLRWVAAMVGRGAGSTGQKGSAKRAESLPVQGSPEIPTGTDGGGMQAGWTGPVSSLSSVRGLDGGAADVPVRLSYVLALLQGAGSPSTSAAGGELAAQ